MSKVGASWPHALDTGAVDNLSPGVSETARKLAGRARWLYEMATGESGDSSESPIVPVNPQGLYGVDHSGPPYGVALRHPIVCFGSTISSDLNTSYWLDVEKVNISADVSAVYNATGWVKPHIDQIGPYSYGFAGLSAIRTGGSTVTVTIEVENRSTGQPATSATLSLSTANLTTNSTLLKVPLVSGWNDFRVTITSDGSAFLNGWAINQVTQFRDS